MNIKPFIKAQLYTLLFLFVFLVITAFGAGIWAFSKVQNFTNSAGVGLGELKQTAQEGWEYMPAQEQGFKNIMILGLDTLETRPGSPALTDTMMLVSLGLGEEAGSKSGQVSMISLPRDLWSEDYQTRINALYHYGQERDPQNPVQFPKEVIEEMTGLTLHHTLVLSFEQVAEVIDMLGGLEVDVPVGFVDEEFPRSDVDVTVVHDPDLLYKTVEFETGKQMMSGEKVLEYIRSRKSGDDEGTDMARGSRQQLVIESLINRLKQKEIVYDLALMGSLYRYYLDNFAASISPQELISLGRALYPDREQIQFDTNNLSVYPDDEFGVIWHPPEWQYQGEWVYAVRDMANFRQEVQNKLN